MKRVLILGGGFGGIYAALELEKALGRQPDFEITLISHENFLLFTPMLHEVAAGDVSITDIVCPIRQLLKHTSFLQGEVKAIDLEARRVLVMHCSGSESDYLKFDYLLIALGSQTNYFGLPGIPESALPMKSLGDAIKLRNHMIASLEEAEFDAVTGRQEPLLTFVIAGAGFAGAETAGAINDFLREGVKLYPHLKEDMVKVLLVDMIPTPLPELGPELGKYAALKLAERKVELRMSTKIKGWSDRGLEFGDGTFTRAVLVVWTAGVMPHPLVKTLPLKLDRNRLVANEFMEVDGATDVWAIGDCAMILDPTTGKPYPPTAQHASRQGKVVARNILCALSGTGKKEAFVFKTLGMLAALGRHSGVADIMGLRFSGFIAWVLWRTIYLSKLPGLDRQIRVAFNWTLDLLFKKDFVQFMTLAAPLVQNIETGAAKPETIAEPVLAENKPA